MVRTQNTFLHLFYRQWFWYAPTLPTTMDLSSRTAFISGSNTGLGYEAAKQLLSRGLSTLIMGVRTPSKGEAARLSLLEYIKTQHPALPEPTIEVWELEMTSYESVMRFVERYRKEERHFDFAILNAGMTAMEFALSSHGNEVVSQANWLSTALLTLLLRKAMNDSYARISTTAEGKEIPLPVLEIVGSGFAARMPLYELLDAAQKDGKGLLESMNTRREIEWTTRYGISKLLIHIFFHRLVELLPSPSSTTSTTTQPENSVILTLIDPALCSTSLNKFSGFMAFAWYVYSELFMNAHSSSVGARNLSWGAAMVGREEHGGYFNAGRRYLWSEVIEDAREGQKKGVQAMEHVLEETVRELGKVVDVESLLK